jgi:uncharacterized phage protein (TIGR01671 family)
LGNESFDAPEVKMADRQIKFRGLRLDNKEWVYGYYCYNEITGKGEISNFDFMLKRRYIYYVDPATVGEFTGLPGKNGREIYEGDIVQWDDRSDGKYWRIAKAIFENGMFGFEIIKAIPEESCDIGYKFIGNFSYQDSTERDLEVIGNIYENEPGPAEGNVKSV